MLNFLHIAFVVRPLYDWFKNQHSFFRFSFWFTLVWLFFIVHKLYLFEGAENNELFIDGFLTIPIIYSVCCLFSFQIGAFKGKQSSIHPKNGSYFRKSRFKTKGLIKLVFLFSAVGIGFQYMINSMPEEILNSAWSGKILIYLFFSRLFAYSIPIAILLLLTQRLSKTTKIYFITIIVIGVFMYLEPIIYRGRRGLFIEFISLFIMPLFFQKQFRIKKILIIPLFLFAFLMIENIGIYRRLVIKENLSPSEAISSILSTTDHSDFTRENYIELENYIYLFNITLKEGNYDLGTIYWDFFIKDYFPAQLFGREIKEKLMINGNINSWRNSNRYGYTTINGSTTTGLTDSFKSFSFLGVIIFFCVGYFMERNYYNALQKSFISIVLYCVLFREGLHVISHGNFMLFSKLIHVVFFLIIPLHLIKVNNAKSLNHTS